MTCNCMGGPNCCRYRARSVFPEPKFCFYCDKAGHSDSECWCTRVVRPDPLKGEPLATYPAAFTWPASAPKTSPELLRAIKLACGRHKVTP